jgi:alkylated DNA repair dioxygenase AlkB
MLLFNDITNNPRHIPVKDGKLIYLPGFIDERTSEILIDNLRKEIIWKQETLKIFGRQHLTPRLTAWYGDPGMTYSYSGLKLQPVEWTHTLQEVKKQIEQKLYFTFNSVLLNWYRNGNDSMGWHADDEKELGKNPVIASLSLGQSRFLHFRRKDNHKDSFKILLENGSLLIMSETLQHYWQHALPKSTKPMGERMNLTFRTILPGKNTSE